MARGSPMRRTRFAAHEIVAELSSECRKLRGRAVQDHNALSTCHSLGAASSTTIDAIAEFLLRRGSPPGLAAQAESLGSGRGCDEANSSGSRHAIAPMFAADLRSILLPSMVSSEVIIAQTCSRHPCLARQREKRPGGGALGQRLGNCGGAGGDGADCPSVPSGLAASVKSWIGGFLGGSTTVCGRCSLRADLTCFDGLLASFFDGFSGRITGVASGKSSANNPRPLGSFSDSTQRKKASFSSSIAAHPARPKLADRASRTSAARAQARIGTVSSSRTDLLQCQAASAVACSAKSAMRSASRANSRHRSRDWRRSSTHA